MTKEELAKIINNTNFLENSVNSRKEDIIKSNLVIAFPDFEGIKLMGAVEDYIYVDENFKFFIKDKEFKELTWQEDNVDFNQIKTDIPHSIINVRCGTVDNDIIAQAIVFSLDELELC